MLTQIVKSTRKANSRHIGGCLFMYASYRLVKYKEIPPKKIQVAVNASADSHSAHYLRTSVPVSLNNSTLKYLHHSRKQILFVIFLPNFIGTMHKNQGQNIVHRRKFLLTIPIFTYCVICDTFLSHFKRHF